MRRAAQWTFGKEKPQGKVSGSNVWGWGSSLVVVLVDLEKVDVVETLETHW